MSDRCITCYRPIIDGEPCPCGCGRMVCVEHRQPRQGPTATQLYNAVKERRAEHAHRILTIPEIDAVLAARAAFIEGTADSTQEPCDG